MSYSKIKDCWNGIESYNLSGVKMGMNKEVNKEDYVPPVTMSLPEWQKYVSRGDNVLLGSGGVIPGGPSQIGWGGGGSVDKGHVRQGWYGA